MTVEQARAAYDERAWSRAVELYADAGQLGADDLERHAIALMMLGRMDDYFSAREAAYHQLLEAGDAAGATKVAFWIGAQRMVAGEVGLGSGWLARAERLVAEQPVEGVAIGYVSLARNFEAAATGDFTRAMALVDEAVAIGRRHRDGDLPCLALHQLGVLLLGAGRVEEGLARLDESMLELTAGGVSPMVTGIVYCGVIAGCWNVYELRRAQEWTDAMARWCKAQPELGNFNGECKVRRAELKQLHGEWSQALDDLALVAPSDVDPWAAGAAAYVRGNLDRLQGRFDDAEEAFSVASRLGWDPQPGLALLRLAKGSVQAAAAMIRRALAEPAEHGKRVELLVGATEVFLAAAELDEGEATAEELAELARTLRTPVIEGLAAHARAAVCLARGDHGAALAPARSALQTWVRLRAPYTEARARVLVAEACRALGDAESARAELGHADAIFTRLGAAPDVARMQQSDDVLSPRELEVLRLLATGATNKAIADKLVLSERTVDRHVSNIFGKLRVSSRSAATAYAFERQLV